MKPFDRLSEIVIQTLKEFSLEKRPLTVDSLRNALSANTELASLVAVPGIPPDLSDCDMRQSLKTPARVALKCASPAKPEFESPLLKKIRASFSQVLDGMDPIAREDSLERLAQVKESVQNSGSMGILAQQGDEVVETINLIIGRAIDQIDHFNDFLSELSENLGSMEKELFSYQTHSRETFLLHDKFCDNLLSHTEDLSDAVTSMKPIEDTRHFIASRLTSIGKAIEQKRREDEDRLKEADSKIAELQSSVRNYNEEILVVTERANALEKEALLDPLTQINNRRAYDLKMRECLRSYHRNGSAFSLILIDVDHFKYVNDHYGHRAGDKCLQEVAKIVGLSLRKTDFLSRYGGEEIVAILPGSSSKDAAIVAEKIRARIDKTRFYYQDEVIPLTISLGVSEVQPADTDTEMPFVRVDAAMYQAKKGGRNRVCVA